MNALRLLAATAATLALAAPALADFNNKNPITVTVTGATPTGYPRAMVEGLNAIVREAYPNSAISLKPNSPGGGLLAVAEGEADFTATSTGTEIALANDGKPPYQKSYKGKFSYAFMLFDVQYMHFIMTKAWADANGIKSWEDIAAKKPRMRLAINRIDNPQTTIGGPYEMMKAHGFTYEDIQKWGGSYVLGNSTVGLDAMVDGKADVFMNVRTLGDSLIKDIAGKRELLWIDAKPDMVAKAAAAFAFKVGTVPKGVYPFVDKDFPTIQQWAAYVAGSHVSEETVYKFVKAIGEAEDRVRKIGGSLKDFKAQDMARNPANLPYHPGALRYYKEKGWVK
jgi:TRAP transporter TAXI family solute receptor